jgi:hypothetical protein
VDDSCFLTSSLFLLSLEIAFLSPEGSTLYFFLNLLTRKAVRRWSKSSPPRCVSPEVALTSKKPESMLRMETSKVPPPRS